jgi:hypothetical protein
MERSGFFPICRRSKSYHGTEIVIHRSMLDDGALYESEKYTQNSANLQPTFTIMSDASPDFTLTHEPREEN